MEVELEVTGSQGERTIVATTLLNHSTARRRATARFVVDTGSPVTIINEAQRQQLQISNDVLNHSEVFSCVGGGNIQTSVLENATIQFKSNGLTAAVNQDIYVSNQQENLLGLDFFEENNLDLHIVNDEEDGIRVYFED